MNGYDEPTFNSRGMCMHCAEYDDVTSVEDNPVCGKCFDEYYNEDWTLRIRPIGPLQPQGTLTDGDLEEIKEVLSRAGSRLVELPVGVVIDTKSLSIPYSAGTCPTS
ncbi:MAG: hypothetical protein PSX80_03345 [bacterium]|nr:hypothetical protein [bacterium]